MFRDLSICWFLEIDFLLVSSISDRLHRLVSQVSGVAPGRAALMPVLLAGEFPLGGSERGSNGAVMRPAGQAIPHTTPLTHTCEKPKIWGLAIPYNTCQFLAIQRKAENLGPRGLGSLWLKAADQEELSALASVFRFYQMQILQRWGEQILD